VVVALVVFLVLQHRHLVVMVAAQTQHHQQTHMDKMELMD
jgi:hypothetical protein